MIDGAGSILVRHGRGQKLGRHPLEEAPVPAIRREGRRQHVVADYMEGGLAVVLAIPGSSLPHVRVGRLPPAVEPLGDQDEDAADDRRPVPSGDARINPERGSRDEIQRRPPAQLPPVDYRLQGLSRTQKCDDESVDDKSTFRRHAGVADYRKILAQNVKAARKAIDLSQEALALETEIDRTYISGIERALRNPSLTLIVKLAECLKTTPGELLTPPRDRS